MRTLECVEAIKHTHTPDPDPELEPGLAIPPMTEVQYIQSARTGLDSDYEPKSEPKPDPLLEIYTNAVLGKVNAGLSKSAPA